MKSLVAFCAFFILLLLPFPIGLADVGPPQKITYDITGVSDEVHKNIEERLHVISQQFPDTIDKDELDRILAQSEKEILLAIQPFGYFHPRISHGIKKEANHIVLHFGVHSGPPVRIRTVTIKLMGEGEKDEAMQKALSKATLIKAGETFATETYSETQTFLFTLAHRYGYMKAAMTQHEIQINVNNNTADIYLSLDTGPRFYYGPITFAPSPYDSNFLARFVPFHETQPYSSTEVQALQETLSNSKYFSSVTVNPTVEQANSQHEVPIVIDTQAVKSQQYNFGLGYGTNTGTRTSIGIDLFRVTDTGQHLSTLLNLSTVNTSLSIKYYIPGQQPAINQYTTSFYLGQFSPDAGKAFTKKLSASYETKLNSHWDISSNLNFLTERFSLDDDPYHTTNLIYPSVYLSRLSADNPLNPEKGSRITFETSSSAPGLDTTFLQMELSGKWIYPPTQHQFLILRGDIGTIYADHYDDTFPLSMRYFAGGYGSVRGYSYQSMGPGKYLKVVSAEIQQHIMHDFFVGLFLDAGTASDDLTEPLERGLGIDFIYRTSVGPLSISIAQATTEPDKPIRIEFNVGTNL